MESVVRSRRPAVSHQHGRLPELCENCSSRGVRSRYRLRSTANGRGTVSLMADTQAVASHAAATSSAFDHDSTRETLRVACARVNLNAEGAELIRLGENAVYRLAQPVIVRIARTVAYEQDARKEVAVSRWLTDEGFPATRALPVEQPVIVDGRVATFWESLSEAEEYGAPRDVAELLTRLEVLLRTYAKCLVGQDEASMRRISDVLGR